MWTLGEDNRLMPHRRLGHYDYSAYKPPEAKKRIDLLYINGNHFERIELIESRESEFPNINNGEATIVKDTLH